MVRLTGTIDAYNGLTEIMPAQVTVLEQGTRDQEPPPREVTVGQVTEHTTAEPLEGSLVKLTAKVVSVPSRPAGGGYNVSITNGLNNMILRVMTGIGIDVASLQVDQFYSFIGVLGQYDSGENDDPNKHFTTGYQLLPRGSSDIIGPVEPVDTVDPRLVAAAARANDRVELIFSEPLAEGADTVYHGDFNGFQYRANAEEQVQLLEVGNGFGGNYVYAEDQYQRALDSGWRVGATNNSDYHGTEGATWGFITPHRTGVLARSLTPEDLLESIRNMRTFATEDKNFEIKYSVDGYWMGSSIIADDRLDFKIEYSDPDGEITARIDLVTNSGQVARSIQPGQAGGTWEFGLEGLSGSRYYYVRVVQADGDRVITSPVWIQGEQGVLWFELSL